MYIHPGPPMSSCLNCHEHSHKIFFFESTLYVCPPEGALAYISYIHMYVHVCTCMSASYLRLPAGERRIDSKKREEKVYMYVHAELTMMR